MQTPTVEMQQHEAQNIIDAYRGHLAKATKEDREILAICRAVKKRVKVIRAIQSIVNAGLHPPGHPYAGLPKLAIARADQQIVRWDSLWRKRTGMAWYFRLNLNDLADQYWQLWLNSTEAGKRFNRERRRDAEAAAQEGAE